MIVEERKTKAKARLRSPVLLVKFLTILCMSIIAGHRGCHSLPRSRSRPSAKAQKRDGEARKDAARNGRYNERTRGSLISCTFFSILPLFSLELSTRTVPRLCIGQSNDSTHFFLIISRATFLVPYFLHFFFLFSSFIFTCIRFVSFSLSLSYTHTHSSQLRFLALLELLAAGLTVVVGLALQGGLLGLRVLTLLLLLLLRRRVRRSRDRHLDRPSEIVYARR